MSNDNSTLIKFNAIFKKELYGKIISFGKQPFDIELTEDEIHLIKYHLKYFGLVKYTGALKPVSKMLIVDFVSWDRNEVYFIINSSIKL